MFLLSSASCATTTPRIPIVPLIQDRASKHNSALYWLPLNKQSTLPGSIVATPLTASIELSFLIGNGTKQPLLVSHDRSLPGARVSYRATIWDRDGSVRHATGTIERTVVIYTPDTYIMLHPAGSLGDIVEGNPRNVIVLSGELNLQAMGSATAGSIGVELWISLLCRNVDCTKISIAVLKSHIDIDIVEPVLCR